MPGLRHKRREEGSHVHERAPHARPGDPDTDPAPIDRSMLRLARWLLLAGQLLYILVTQFHAGGDANDHREIFLHYAGSGDWKGVHVGQFAAMAVIVAGLLTLGHRRRLPCPGVGRRAGRVLRRLLGAHRRRLGPQPRVDGLADGRCPVGGHRL